LDKKLRVLIVENESYLAQSIASKLNAEGYECEIAITPDEAEKEGHFDVVLLSTTLINQNFKSVLKRYRDKSVVILLNSYITNDTVAKPIEDGASDYILKPFTMIELIRKINHYIEFNQLKKNYLLKEQYIKFLFDKINIDKSLYSKKLPILAKSNVQNIADCFAFRYAEMNNYDLIFVDLLQESIPKNIGLKELVVAINFHKIKKLEKKNIINAKHTRVIISTVNLKEEDIENFDNFELRDDSNVLENTPTLTIDEYTKFSILKYQDFYPDTEISKKLGISRKSLWEKRKKYGFFKK
jgi:DNA-binding NtrC family response regulator